MPECTKVLQHAAYRGSDGAVTCCLCDSETEWRDCDQCGGDGFIELYEDDPINFGPDELGTCPSCSGNGGDHVCTTEKCPTVTILSIFAEKPKT